ncbi:hypothetical protein SAMN04488074_1362 [Lentzea albidocapillata subsp. violacea]|uniref:Uncharacterized protein n=1 Tax=Lentzea albidocapillata subsp. violacea TaxID=128104 RepID=A0A1G9YVP2_9PSEU|nr:hypothetical protein [Lentzea albidocapillata]SDN13228.1 hypothetical protein SAMN04488074_1362 [Lentzea albidocapillata subsp. violacea]
MGKGRRVRAARAQKRTSGHEHQGQVDRDSAVPFTLPGGWQFIDDDGDDLDDVVFPDDALLDPSSCPIGHVCVGCGGHEGLAATTAAFSRPGGGFDVACATVCRSCDGRSFLQMLDQHGLDRAFTRHAEHAVAQPGQDGAHA